MLGPDFRFPMRDARLSMARLCALQGRYDEATEWFAKAREVLDEQGWRPLRAICDYDEALMYLRRGAADGTRARSRCSPRPRGNSRPSACPAGSSAPSKPPSPSAISHGSKEVVMTPEPSERVVLNVPDITRLRQYIVTYYATAFEAHA